MSSNLACVGLAADDPAALGHLLEQAQQTAQPVGSYDGVTVTRWQDASGAALILGVRSDELVDLLPTYAATSGGTVADCRLINESVASAAVVDGDGEQLTAMAFEAEQYRQLESVGRAVARPALITALGVSVQIHADEEAFESSADSLLHESAEPDEPPAEYVERGWSWPPRMAAESFISHGVFGDPAQSTAHAHLSGVVLRGQHHVCGLTGQGFSAVTVRTVGFEATVCLADSEHPDIPTPGNIVSGTVFLVARVDSDELTERRPLPRFLDRHRATLR